VSNVVGDSSKVITILSGMSIEEGLSVLSTNKILSAPVLDNTTGEILGLVDMLDLVTFVLSQYQNSNFIKISYNKGEDVQTIWKTWCQDRDELQSRGSRLTKQPITSCMNISMSNPMCSVNHDSSLTQLLFLFRKGVHRVVVVNKNGEPVNIASQSNLIRLLAKNIHRFGKIAQATIQSIGIGIGSCITINETAEAVHAFHLLKLNAVSAVGIVNSSGTLLANLSVSDLRGLDSSNFDRLSMPVMDYLQKYTETLIPPLTCTLSTTFETVILKLAATGAHRLWNVDEYGRPIGIISLTDVMKLLDLRVYVITSEEIIEKEEKEKKKNRVELSEEERLAELL